MNMQNRIDKCVLEQLMDQNTEIKPMDRMVDDLGMDSLDMVELVMRAEEEFETEISDDDWEKCQTVQDIYDLVEKLT